MRRKEDMAKEEDKVEERWSGRGGMNFGRLFLGLLVILFGVLFFLRNSGLVNVDFALNWGVVWPILIIFLGLSLLSARGVWSVVLGIVVTLLVLALVLGDTFHVTTTKESRTFNWGFSTEKDAQSQDIKVAKESGANSAAVNVKMGAGTLNVAGGSSDLVSGTLRSSFMDLKTESKLTDSKQTVTLTGQGTSRVFGRQLNTMDLKLNNDLPLSTTIDTGAIDMNLDMSDIKLENLDLNTGASSLDLKLGDKVDTSNVSIDAGASSVSISLPKTVGVRLTVSSGLSSRSLDDFKKVSEKSYESNNYDSVTKKIDITLSLGASSLDVNWR